MDIIDSSDEVTFLKIYIRTFDCPVSVVFHGCNLLIVPATGVITLCR